MSDKPKSRQVKWQEKRLAEGKCTRCGKKNGNGKWHCAKCKEKHVLWLKSKKSQNKLDALCEV